MTYFFRLQRTDGLPADPPTYRSTVLSCRQGDTIPLSAARAKGPGSSLNPPDEWFVESWTR